MISATVHLARLIRAGFVFAREGVFGLVDPAPLPPSAQLALRLGRLIERPKSAASIGRISAALRRLGPSYVKLGQFLATRPDVVGMVMARDLESLQDRLPPFPQAEAEAAIVAAFEKPLTETYASFGPAVAAASSPRPSRDFAVSHRTVPFHPPSHRTSSERQDRRAVAPWAVTKVRVVNTG